MNILGISAYYHDSAAAIIIKGEIIAAAQEERFSRKKHDPKFPSKAISYCLHEAGISFKDLDYVVFYDKPFLKFERLLETYVAFAPKGFKSFKIAMPIWLKEKLFLKRTLLKEFQKFEKSFDSNKLMFNEHHLSHAASAFYPSPFEEAIILTIDGVGEWATTTISIGKKNNIEILKEINFPSSLGLLYSAFTYYIGFRVNSGEYKLMGLAPYGKPKYKDIILSNLLDLKDDGSFRLDQSYFNYTTGLTMISKKFIKLFGNPVRKPDVDPINQFHMDIASSIQAVTEEIILKMTRFIAREYKISNLCMAGGVALNCVANGKIYKDRSFKNIWIQPASGDAGGALGCALTIWFKELKEKRISTNTDKMKGSFLGPSYSQNLIEKTLEDNGAKFLITSEKNMLEETTKALMNGQAVGWFQGRMEFGPRALGARSILGDPRSKKMQKLLNLKVKFRESFRPFAPSILIEDLTDWFELDCISPYMLMVDKVKKNKLFKMSKKQENLFGIEKLNVVRSVVPSITHVDYTARIQTVHKETNPLYYKLIKKFKEKTGCPILINTSFNIRGEPIVCSPQDAFKCFMGNGLDMLIIGNCILKKHEQDKSNLNNYKESFFND